MRRAVNSTRGTVLCARMEAASNAISRGKGLMGRRALGDGAGLLIAGGPLMPVMGMHTFFMRFPIDIVFLNRSGKIIRIVHALKPWRLTVPVFGARWALEIEAGTAARTSSRPGDQVSFEEN